MKKISIIIISFNTKELLSQCLSSLKKNYSHELSQGRYEIIVVDNNSSDGTSNYIQKNFPSVKLLTNKENQGFSRANNLAISKSKGEYVLLLNPDTIVPEGTLTVLEKYLDAHPDVAVVTPFVGLADGRIDDACHRGFPTPWRAFTHFSGLGSVFPTSQLLNGYHLGYQNMQEIHDIESAVGACMLIRATTGKKLHWLDTDYFWYGEDLDFCYRVKKLHERVVFIPHVTITHYKGASSGFKKHSQHLSTIDKDTREKIMAARFEVMRIFYKKHYQHVYPRWMMQLVLSGIAFKELITKWGAA